MASFVVSLTQVVREVAIARIMVESADAETAQREALEGFNAGAYDPDWSFFVHVDGEPVAVHDVTELALMSKSREMRA